MRRGEGAGERGEGGQGLATAKRARRHCRGLAAQPAALPRDQRRGLDARATHGGGRRCRAPPTTPPAGRAPAAAAGTHSREPTARGQTTGGDRRPRPCGDGTPGGRAGRRPTWESPRPATTRPSLPPPTLGRTPPGQPPPPNSPTTPRGHKRAGAVAVGHGPHQQAAGRPRCAAGGSDGHRGGGGAGGGEQGGPAAPLVAAYPPRPPRSAWWGHESAGWAHVAARAAAVCVGGGGVLAPAGVASPQPATPTPPSQTPLLPLFFLFCSGPLRRPFRRGTSAPTVIPAGPPLDGSSTGGRCVSEGPMAWQGRGSNWTPN